MIDFTLSIYAELTKSLREYGYSFQTFRDFIKDPEEKTVVMRHDVDKLPVNSLRMAALEADSGIRSSYYFRAVGQSFNEDIIKQIAGMGHEVGYHYENLAEIGKSSEVRQGEFAFAKRRQPGLRQEVGGRSTDKYLHELAIEDFEKNLKRFRDIVPVTTICMHGSPTSKFDSRDLWEKYNYRDLGIIGEPYFDIDFSTVFYLTDTGRRWDGDRFNVRDKVSSQRSAFSLQQMTKSEIPTLHSTSDIIKAIQKDLLPDQIMINTHPQRWTNNILIWTKELVWQNIKNIIKKRINNG